MNPLIIVLGIVIIVFLYYIIQYYFFSVKSLAAKIHLNESPTDISSNVITNPSSALYTFGTWVYVNNFTTCTLFSYVTTPIASPDPRLFSLELGTNNNPTLRAIVKGAVEQSTINITNNFPIQKWVHVLISVDTTYADCYLDGKLIVSRSLSANQITKSPDKIPYITFKQSNSSSPDIYLAKVTRWDHPLDPQSVFTEYSSGNGLSNSDFALGLTVTNDDTTKNYKIYSN